ncbi:MAG: HD domain-containing protein [Chitinophagaceae bacterium]|nr:MAG: HD domain-containing protein [Chitinophagaceae bacterium]
MRSNECMQVFVIGLLEKELPDWYRYHTIPHTMYVMDKVVEIAISEQCTPGEVGLAWVAALWHDTGHIYKYPGHEGKSCELAKFYLPGYGYDESEIDAICGMIMATRTPQSPTNKLEGILADADLEYLGTDEAEEKSGQLFEELKYLDPSLTPSEFMRLQIGFLKDHHFFTAYCVKNKQPAKAAYLARLIEENGDE